MPALDPPEVQMDPELVKKYEAEIEVNTHIPLKPFLMTHIYLFSVF